MKRRTFLHTAGTWAAAGTLGGRDAFAATDEIVIGQSAVLSGPLSPPSLMLQSGVRLAFEEVNAQDGISGRKLKLVALDDALNPDKAVANYRTLVDRGDVLACVAGVGPAATMAGLPVLRAAGVALVGATAVSDSVRERSKGVAYYTRATQQREADVLLQHLATVGMNRMAIAYLGTPGGQEVLTQLQATAEKSPVQIVGFTPVAPDGSNIAEAAKAVVAAKAQAVILYLTAAQAPALIKAVNSAGSFPAYYGMSILAGDATAKQLGTEYRGLTISAVTPYPWDGSNADALRFRRAADQAKVPVGYHSYEGYIAALVLIQALREAGSQLTRAALHASLSRLRTRIAAMEVDFTGDRSTGSRFVELVHARADGRYVR